MTNKEMEARRAKGLCYWCRERFVSDHRCKGKQLFLIEVGEEEIEEQWTEKKQEPSTDGTQETTIEGTPQISIHAISGILHCSTI